MAHFAILAAIEIGLGVAQYFLTPHGSKQQPVDRGRADDLRFTLVAEGTILPRFYGRRIRIGGVPMDGGHTQEIKSSTPGSGGGKKGQGGQPPTTNYSYQKTFAIVWGEGPIRSFRKIKEDDTFIYNVDPDAPGTGTGYYQAEDSSNTLAFGATIVSDATCAGGRRVDLPPGASVSFNNIWKNLTETTALIIYYKCTSAVAVTIRHNGVDDPTTAPNSSGALIASIPINYSLNSGNNTIKITNTSGSETISIDRLFAFPGFVAPGAGADSEITGVKHPTLTYPADLTDPSPFYNYAPFASGTGYITGNLAGAGQAAFELFNGTEDQIQSSILQSMAGRTSANTPAYLGLVMSAFQNYSIGQGKQTLGNMTAEIEPWFDDLADICADIYSLEGVAASEMNFSALAGTIVEGFIYDKREAATPFIQSLCDFYGFDVIPLDGKITAVKRGGAAVLTIPEDELYGRQEGSPLPKGPIAIDHIPDIDIEASVDVNYLDASDPKEFHNSTRHVPRQVGNSLDPATLTFPFVTDADTIVAVGKRWLYERKLAAKPKQFATGPRYRYLIPTDVINVQTATATYRERIIGLQPDFTGLVKFKSVPEKGGLYSQVGSGASAAGSEVPPVKFPANTFLALLDLPPLRLEDDRLGYYRGGCPNGQGSWKGYHLWKEFVDGDYHHIDAEPLPANLGVLTANVSAITDLSVVDHSTSITIDLLFDDGSIQSRTEAEILARPLNELVLGSGGQAEVLRYATATPSTATAPYVSRYVLTTLVRGLYGTEQAAIAGHTAGKSAVCLNDAIKFITEDPAELQRTRNFKAPSVGQSLTNAPAQAFNFLGYSKKPLSVTGITGYRNLDADAVVECIRRVRVAGVIKNLTGVPVAEEGVKLLFEIMSGSTVLKQIWFEVPQPVPVPFYGYVSPPQPQIPQFRTDLRLNPLSSFMEWTVVLDDGSGGITPNSEVILYLYDNDYQTARWSIIVGGYNFGPDYLFQISENGVVKYSVTPTDPGAYPYTLKIRPRVEIANGELVVYDDFPNGRPPVYRSTMRPTDVGPLAPHFVMVGTGGDAVGAYWSPASAPRGGSYVADPVSLNSGKLQIVIPASLQTALFGSPQALGTMKVRITQYSALVGPGTSATALI